MYKQHSQKGIAIGVLLVFVALIAAIAMYVASGSRAKTEDPVSSLSSLRSSAVISQGAALRDGFNVMMARGAVVANITADATASTGLYHPTDGGAAVQTPAAELFATPSSPEVWAIGTALVDGVGTAAADRVIYLPALAETVCQSINNQLYGTTTVNSVTAAAMAANADFAGSGTPARMEGCVELGTSNNFVYYNVVKGA